VNLTDRVHLGFRLMGLGLDAGLVVRSLRGMLAAAGRDRPMTLRDFGGRGGADA
jgi:hypothetical protein